VARVRNKVSIDQYVEQYPFYLGISAARMRPSAGTATTWVASRRGLSRTRARPIPPIVSGAIQIARCSIATCRRSDGRRRQGDGRAGSRRSRA
jgi:hypothetical protein